MVYPVGSYVGYPCTDDWHRGPDYDPSVLVLTTADEKFLRDAKIKV